MLRFLWGLLPLLVCGAAMVGCARMMSRSGDHQQGDSADHEDELRQLREEVARLRALVAEPERHGSDLPTG